MEKIKAFLHAHPIESALLCGVAVIALYVAFKPPKNSGASQEAQLQQAYFAAESIQAQSNAAVQVAGIETSAQTSQTAIAADVSKTNASTYASLSRDINASNNQAAVSALPYAEESHLIDALLGVSEQATTRSSTNNDSGFFGIGASSGSSSTTTPTSAAMHAADYLENLTNGLHAGNGGG